MCDASKTRHTSAGRPALYCSLPVPRPPSAIPPHHPPASIFSVHDHSGCECRSSDPRSALPQLLQVRAGGVALLTASESFGHALRPACVRLSGGSSVHRRPQFLRRCWRSVQTSSIETHSAALKAWPTRTQRGHVRRGVPAVAACCACVRSTTRGGRYWLCEAARLGMSPRSR